LLIRAPNGRAASETETESSEAPDSTLRVYDEVEVKARADDLGGIARSATEGSTGRADLARRPILRSGEVVETVPGLVATQHSGGGKANQYFLRGFNLDHGTDLSLSVAGMPVNQPTHGHGQGYADLGFLVPELIDRVRYRKGAYYADTGDFSAAGAVEVDLVRALDGTHVELMGGSFDYRRALVADSFRLGDGDLLAAVEVSGNDGPWTRGDDYDRFNGVLRYSRGDASSGWSITAMAHDSSWLATDQVPRRAVESGLIGRFDLLDPGPRGSTSRTSLVGEAHWGDARRLTSLSAYVVRLDFDLVSNFTYFLDDPDDGDQFEQVDERTVLGLELRRDWLGSWSGRRVESTVGLDLRGDDIANGLFRTRDLARTGSVRADDVEQLGGGPFAASEIQWTPKLRTVFGLRGELYSADVESDLAESSGERGDLLLLPKASFILGPWRDTEVYVNLGYGHHSNDARGATIRVDPTTGGAAERVPPLVRAFAADVGARTTVLPGVQSTLSLFVLELDSELVFVGDGGFTEASRPSRRVGLEWANVARLTPRLFLDLDVTLARGRFTDPDPAGDRIPGAVARTVAAGLSWTGPGRFSGSLRWRTFGDIPLVEDGSERWGRSSLVNLALGYSLPRGITLRAEVFNLLDSEDSDVEYFYASRLPGEPLEGVEDVHFHPLERRGARLSMVWRLE
jgi:hypothetical protein